MRPKFISVFRFWCRFIATDADTKAARPSCEATRKKIRHAQSDSQKQTPLNKFNRSFLRKRWLVKHTGSRLRPPVSRCYAQRFYFAEPWTRVTAISFQKLLITSCAGCLPDRDGAAAILRRSLLAVQCSLNDLFCCKLWLIVSLKAAVCLRDEIKLCLFRNSTIFALQCTSRWPPSGVGRQPAQLVIV